MKVRKLLALTACVFALGAMSAGGALAAGKTDDTVGNCMSDILYGNEPNMADNAPGGPAQQAPGTKGGNVVPTQSPGPWVNNALDPENPTRGLSAGQWNHPLGVNVPAMCRVAFTP